MSQRHGDAARTCADIRNFERRMLRKAFAREVQSGLYHQFRFWPGDQHRRIDQEIQVPKLLMSGDVLCRLALKPLVQIPAVMDALGVGQLLFRMSKEMCAVAARGMHQQYLRGNARRGNLRLFQQFASLSERFL